MQVTLIAAQSLDGFITRHDEPGTAFTSAADKVHFFKCLRDFDSQIMGAGTFRTWQKEASEKIRPGRPQWVLTRRPQDFVEDAITGWLEFTNAGPEEVLRVLEKRGLQRCALLGGSEIHRLFLAAKCVHEIWLTIEPLLFGGGTPLISEEISAQLRLISNEALSADTILLKYRVL